MTIRHLRIFVAVAETGKMSAAAKQCYITQPTVSQAIHELENHYNVQLFERLSKKLYITESGRQLLIYARKVLEQFDILEANMETFRNTERFRIGTTITVGACLLSSIMKELRRMYPNMQPYACVANTSLIEKKLLNSELDVGLVEGIITSPDLVTIPVADDFLVLAVGTDHPLAKKKQVSVEELSQYDFVMREPGSGTRKLFEDYLNRNHVTYRIAWEATCLDAFKSAIVHNGCIAALSVRLIAEEAKNGQIHVIRNMDSDWDRCFYLVYHKDKLFTEQIRSLESIMAQFKRPEFLDDMETGILTRNKFPQTP